MAEDTDAPWDDSDDDVVYDDGHDDLAALDFSAPQERAEVGEEDGDATDGAALFTVANPAETVAVTTYLNGSVHRVDLDAAVTSMTERQLADEIVVIADLAKRKAQSAVRAFMVRGWGTSVMTQPD